MRSKLFALVSLGTLITLAACNLTVSPGHKTAQPPVTIARSGPAKAKIVVMTQAVAVKETGPAATVKKFGEVYAWSPQTIIVRRGEPTEITFWNLQPDDEHDFMLTAPNGDILLKTTLEPLTKTTYVMTFHRKALFPFYCTVHQPEMSGQILVTDPASGS